MHRHFRLPLPTKSGPRRSIRHPALLAVTMAAGLMMTRDLRAASLTWDANGTGAGQTNGGGGWLNANQWWTGSSNTTWSAGNDAVFGGAATAGGAVTLAGTTTVNSVTFNNFTGTYTLGSAGQAITLASGITKASGAAATFASPLVLGGPQTWTNSSAGTLRAGAGVNNDGHLLTVDGTGNFEFHNQTTIITGAGGLTKNGPGNLTLGAGGTPPAHNYTGPTTINGGIMMVFGNKTSGNFTLNNGMLTDYYQQTTVFTGGLGAGVNQIQILGNSGFGGGNGTSTWRIGGSGSMLRWGSEFFNPTSLRFLTSADNMGPSIHGQASLDNSLNLNGEARTIDVLAGTGPNALANSWGRITGAITNATGRIVKTGGGNLLLSGTNLYGGGTAINQGMVRFESKAAMPNTNEVSVASGALLGVLVNNGGTGWGGGAGAGGIAGLTNGVGGQPGSTVTFAGASGLFLNVTADTTEGNVVSNGGASALSLFKFGANRLTLSAHNTFTGGLTVGAGTVVLSGDNALAGAVQVNAGTLQLSHTNAVDSAASLTLASATTLNLRADAADSFNGPAVTVATSGTGTATIHADRFSTGADHTLSMAGGLASSQGHGNISTIVFAGANGYSLGFPSLTISRFGGGGGGGGTILDPQTARVTIGPVSASATQPLLITLDGNTSGNTIGGITQGSGAAISLTKADNSTWTISGTSNHTGVNTVSAGKLFIQGNHSAATGALTVAANATLGGKGTLGGNATVSNNGRLEFELSTPAASHDPLDVVAGRTFAFAGDSVLTITSPGGAAPGVYTLVSAPGGLTGSAPSILNLPANWSATVSVTGTALLLNVTSTGSGATFADWQTANATAGGLNADHDGDGVGNGVEWFVHGGASSSTPDAAPGVFSNVGGLTVTWTRSPDYPGAYGTHYLVETADSPSGPWQSETVGGNVTLTGQEVRFTFPEPLPARRYAQLRVNGP